MLFKSYKSKFTVSRFLAGRSTIGRVGSQLQAHAKHASVCLSRKSLRSLSGVLVVPWPRGKLSSMLGASSGGRSLAVARCDAELLSSYQGWPTAVEESGVTMKLPLTLGKLGPNYGETNYRLPSRMNSSLFASIEDQYEVW